MFNQSLADQASQQVDGALNSTQKAASQAVDSLGKSMESGMNRVRETTHQLRDTAARASEGTVNYIRHDPLKSVLMAAATGAALMALISLLNRSNNRN
jgi:ElaB/YqjD/DUF883 family membrane-anchored ribosome-binding protein